MAASCRWFQSSTQALVGCRPLLLSHKANVYRPNQFNKFSSSANEEVECPGKIVSRDTQVDTNVSEILEKNQLGVSGHISYRKHPGIMRLTRSSLPTRLVKAIKVLLERYPVASLATKTDKLVRYLNQRQPPLNHTELSQKVKSLEETVFADDRSKFDKFTGLELEDALEEHRKKILSRLRKTVYHWKPMQYDAFTSYIYLLGRLASDFSVQVQCFTEISKRDPAFRPTSIFHHGSKVGAGVWASNEIWQTVGEHYCVDASTHMNTISRLLLQDGNEQERVLSIPGVHFRNFNPSPKQNKFSMVVSAYNLMEQPSQGDRNLIVKELWEMTQSYLVLIEVGTGAGFKLVNEAREMILQLSSEGNEENNSSGHVFAPCPHDKLCPKINVKNQLCLAECVTKNVDFTKKTMPETSKSNVKYSYIIMKRGPRQKAWPRILHSIKAQRHTHCHLCLPCGELQHVIISKAKYDKHLYSCARYSNNGDLLPVNLANDQLTDSPQDAKLPLISQESVSVRCKSSIESSSKANETTEDINFF